MPSPESVVQVKPPFQAVVTIDRGMIAMVAMMAKTYCRRAAGIALLLRMGWYRHLFRGKRSEHDSRHASCARHSIPRLATGIPLESWLDV